MFHACVQRFDVTGNLEKFGVFGGTKQPPIHCVIRTTSSHLIISLVSCVLYLHVIVSCLCGTCVHHPSFSFLILSRWSGCTASALPYHA